MLDHRGAILGPSVRNVQVAWPSTVIPNVCTWQGLALFVWHVAAAAGCDGDAAGCCAAAVMLLLLVVVKLPLLPALLLLLLAAAILQ